MNFIFTRRNIIGTTIIIFIIFLCTLATAFALFSECVTNYTTLMPVYEGAALVESESSLLNYLGMGNLRTVWFVAADTETVQQWYTETLSNQQRAIREAQRNGEPPPPEWDGEWRVEAVDDGTQIHMQANCFQV